MDVTGQPSPALSRRTKAGQNEIIHQSCQCFVIYTGTELKTLEELFGVDCVRRFEGHCACLPRKLFSVVAAHLSPTQGSLSR